MKNKVGYGLQKGCWNCARVKVVGHYNSDTEYFCHADKAKRPPPPRFSSIDTFTETSKTWDAWHDDGRKVDAVGICDNWKGQR